MCLQADKNLLHVLVMFPKFLLRHCNKSSMMRATAHCFEENQVEMKVLACVPLGGDD